MGLDWAPQSRSGKNGWQSQLGDRLQSAPKLPSPYIVVADSSTTRAQKTLGFGRGGGAVPGESSRQFGCELIEGRILQRGIKTIQLIESVYLKLNRYLLWN